MKNMKKLFAIVLAVIMVMSLATTAFAAGTNTITVTDAKKGETYEIYKMLDLEVNSAMTAYTYTVNEAWNNFFGNDGAGATYVDIDEQGYVTWKEDMDEAEQMEAFAKVAAAYAAKNNLTSVVDAITPEADGNITFEGLDAGYYLITSTYGTLAMVDTTPNKPNATINEKNPKVTQNKEVKEDSTSEWGDNNTAQIGDTVEFQVTINLKKGAKNVVLHDQMEDGLTFNANSVKITGLKDTDYTVVTEELTDGCTFEIRFAQAYLDTLSNDTDVFVTYDAILNEKADITNGELNESQVTWGNNSSTVWDETKTTTLTFDIVKTDSALKVLDGAKFKLYNAETEGNEIPVVKVSDGVYRVAVEGETGVEIETVNGKATVQGLDAGTTYWLEETVAPVGYNKLASRVEVKIENDNLSTTMTGDTWNEGDGGVQITNNAGVELPSTGGMGTTLFYIVGGVLVAGAAILLVAKKRMTSAE